MQTWFDAQLDQKILDGIYSAGHLVITNNPSFVYVPIALSNFRSISSEKSIAAPKGSSYLALNIALWPFPE